MKGVTLESVEDEISLLESTIEHIKQFPNSDAIRKSLAMHGCSEELPIIKQQVRLEQQTIDLYKKELKELVKLRKEIVKQMCIQSK